MRIEKVREARAEALRFVKKADEMIAKHESDHHDDPDRRRSGYIWGGVQSGALRRSSLDLTRMLAELRRP